MKVLVFKIMLNSDRIYPKFEWLEQPMPIYPIINKFKTHYEMKKNSKYAIKRVWYTNVILHCAIIVLTCIA